MARDVIMPALGMAQDTGLLLVWRKKPGDAVAVGDVLFEVETDKAVSEVEAQDAGFLAAVGAAEGDAVPVGQTIAQIVATPAEVDGAAVAEARPTAPEPEQPAPEPEAPARARTTPAPVRPEPAPVVTGDRVLASPKVRRLAREQGLDLGRLAASGLPQPFHVRDLAHFATLAAPASAVAQPGGPSMVSATCDRAAFDAFLASMEGRTRLEPHLLAAGFAAASLRPTHGDGTLVVAVEAVPARARVAYADPDRTRPSRPRVADPETGPALILRDLTGSRLTAMALAGDPAPALSLAADADRFTLTLAFRDDRLSPDDAAAFLDAMAARLENPMENLV